MDKKTFSDKLVLLRKNTGLTQKELCDKLQISLSSYKHFETAGNDNLPNYETLIRLSVFFDVSIDYLLGMTDNPQKH